MDVQHVHVSLMHNYYVSDVELLPGIRKDSNQDIRVSAWLDEQRVPQTAAFFNNNMKLLTCKGVKNKKR